MTRCAWAYCTALSTWRNSANRAGMSRPCCSQYCVRGSARDIFEREIRLAVLGDAGIQQASNVRVAKARKDLTLATEALGQQRSQNRMHELESHLAGKQAVDALREPDTAHAAMTEERENSIRAESSIDERRVGRERRRQRCRHRPPAGLGSVHLAIAPARRAGCAAVRPLPDPATRDW